MIFPGATPENKTVAGRPPIVTFAVTPVKMSGDGGAGCPEARGGATEPSPVAKIVIVCPGKTGFDALIRFPV
jgi:hypothetical protein